MQKHKGVHSSYTTSAHPSKRNSFTGKIVQMSSWKIFLPEGASSLQEKLNKQLYTPIFYNDWWSPSTNVMPACDLTSMAVHTAHLSFPHLITMKNFWMLFEVVLLGKCIWKSCYLKLSKVRATTLREWEVNKGNGTEVNLMLQVTSRFWWTQEETNSSLWKEKRNHKYFQKGILHQGKCGCMYILGNIILWESVK